MTTLEQKTNFVAAYVSAGLAASLPQLMSSLGVKPRDSFELGFNRATGLAAAGDLETAEAAVKAAYKQGALLFNVRGCMNVCVMCASVCVCVFVVERVGVGERRCDDACAR